MKIAIKEIKKKHFKLIKKIKRRHATYFVECNKRSIKINAILYEHLRCWLQLRNQCIDKLKMDIAWKN